MATTVDDTGKLAGWHAVVFSVALFPVTLFAIWPYNIWAILLLGLAIWLAIRYLKASIQFLKKTDTANARSLFRVSLVYLTAYLFVLAIWALVGLDRSIT